MSNNEFEFEYGLRKVAEVKPSEPATVNISVKLVKEKPVMLITGNKVAAAIELNREDYERVKAIIFVQNFLQ